MLSPVSARIADYLPVGHFKLIPATTKHTLIATHETRHRFTCVEESYELGLCVSNLTVFYLANIK